MPIKFRPKETGKKLKEIIIKRITDPGNPYTKPKPVIELNKAFSVVMDQKTFAVYSFRRGNINKVVGARGTRLDRRINRAAKDRLKYNLVSEEAVGRLKDIKRQQLEGKIQKKISTTVGQDLKRAGKNVGTAIVNTPTTIKTGLEKVGTGVKEVYGNTSEVLGNVAKTTVNHPELVAGQAIISPTGRVIANSVLGPAANAAYQVSPVGPGGIVGAVGESIRQATGNKVTEITLPNGTKRFVTKRVARARKANEAKRKIAGEGWSIQGGVNRVENAAKSLLTPINPNYNPSYQLKRVTI